MLDPMIIKIFLFIVLLACMIIDNKYKIIPDLITGPLFLFGFIIAVYESFTGLFTLNHALTIIAYTSLAISFYRMNLWGGGDTKLLTALSLYSSYFNPLQFLSILFIFSLVYISVLKLSKYKGEIPLGISFFFSFLIVL